jgi:hypothetical protein
MNPCANPWLPLLTSVLVALAGLAGVAVGALLNARVAKGLAEQTARLARGTNLHLMQVEHLGKLGRFLFEATENGIMLTFGSRLNTDPSDQEIVKFFRGSLRSAYNEYLDCRLLLPPAVATQVESFFRKMADYRIQLGGLELTPAGDRHAEAFTAAQQTANKEIPELLKTIDDSARRIIGSD